MSKKLYLSVIYVSSIASGGLVVSVSAYRVLGRGFAFRPIYTKYHHKMVQTTSLAPRH